MSSYELSLWKRAKQTQDTYGNQTKKKHATSFIDSISQIQIVKTFQFRHSKITGRQNVVPPILPDFRHNFQISNEFDYCFCHDDDNVYMDTVWSITVAMLAVWFLLTNNGRIEVISFRCYNIVRFSTSIVRYSIVRIPRWCNSGSLFLLVGNYLSIKTTHNCHAIDQSYTKWRRISSKTIVV